MTERERELLEHAWDTLRRHRGFNAARRQFRTVFESGHGCEWWYLAPKHEHIES